MKTVVQFVITAFLIIIMPLPTNADKNKGIRLDGTVGNAGQLDLPGPDYDIRAEYGQQAGTNLFHSFQQFNIHQGESATFTGPDVVQNIISRVIGGSASWIDGRLSSAIPGADLYLLNPAGVMFGKNAAVDMSGSFHVSTADWLRLGNDDRFYSTPHANDVLSVSSPAAFGFLDSEISPITFEGGEIADPVDENHASIRVSEDETVSVVGGDIEMKGIFYQKSECEIEAIVDFPIYDENGQLIGETGKNDEHIPICFTDENGDPILATETVNLANIAAPAGQIIVTAAASEGEVEIGHPTSEFHETGGNITLSDDSKIDVSGEGGGNIFIRSGQLLGHDTGFYAKTLGEKDGGVIDIQCRDILFRSDLDIVSNTESAGRASDISIRAEESVTIQAEESIAGLDSCTISSSSEDHYYNVPEAFGDAGNILIEADEIMLSNVRIDSRARGTGDAGDVTLKARASISFDSGNISSDVYERYGNVGNPGNLMFEAENISLTAISSITSSHDGTGQGGHIALKAGNSLNFDASSVDMSSEGDGGRILMDAEDISFANGSYIRSSSYGENGGEITLKAGNSVSFSGITDNSEETYVSMQASEQGNVGTLTIEAKDISFADYANIYSETKGTGNGGTILLKAEHSVSFVGGDSILEVAVFPNVGILRHGQTGITISSEHQGEGGGAAGSLQIEAEDISFMNGAFINSDTSGTGAGGDIRLEARNSVCFEGEPEIAQVSSDERWTSRIKIGTQYEGEGAGAGGSLAIEAQDIRFAGGAYINSETLGTGKGGDIRVTASGSVLFEGEDQNGTASRIQASTKYDSMGAGDAGNLEIDANSISLTQGGYVNASSYGMGKGGQVTLKAEQVKLEGTDTTENSSRIYSGSENASSMAGSGGKIVVSARELFLGDRTSISTSVKGGGTAGDLELNANHILMEGDASITSGSEAPNIHSFGTLSERDEDTLISGDRVKVSNAFYVFTGELTGGLAEYAHVYRADRPQSLPTYSVREGSLAEILSDGNGSPDRYVAVYIPMFGEFLTLWIKFDSDNVTTVPDMGEIEAIHETWISETELPEYAGGILHVLDAGNGKEALFACVRTESSASVPTYYHLKAIPLGHFEVNDMPEMNDLLNRYALRNGDVVSVRDTGDGVPAAFAFYGGDYLRLTENVHELETKHGIYDLIQPQIGEMARVTDAGYGNTGEFIYSGKEWLPLTDSYHLVETMTELGRISPDPGDVAYVSDTGEGMPENFLFSDGKWVAFAANQGNDIRISADTLIMRGASTISASTTGHGSAADITLNVDRLEMEDGASVASGSLSEKFGGNAGTITANARDSVRLSRGAEMTTETRDAGGGRINVNADNELYLLDSGISSSVAIGHGKGGDVTAESEFIILNSGDITANADQGDGGAIFIRSENFLKSSDSVMTASSNLGNQGSVRIEAPDVDIASSLSLMPDAYLDVEKWAKTPCEQRTAEDVSRFVIKGRDAVPAWFDDYLPSPPPETDEHLRKGDFSGAVRELEGKNSGVQGAVRLAYAYTALGHHRTALSLLNDIAPIAETGHDSYDNAWVRAALGDLHLCLGNMRQAIDNVKKGLEHARLTRDPLLIASVLNNLGNVRAAGRNYRGAMAAYQDQVPFLGDSEEALSLKSKLLLNMARAELGSGHSQKALGILEDAAAAIERQPDAYDKAFHLIALSLLVRQTSQVSETPRIWLADAARIGEDMGNPRITSCAYGFLGEVHETNGRHEDAAKMTRKAIFLAHQGDCPEILYRWQWQLGRLFKKIGETDLAMESYQNAIQTLDPIRTQFFTGFRKSGDVFDEEVRPVYLGLAELFLEAAGTWENSQDMLRQGRDVVELLKKAELENYFQDECLTVRECSDHVPTGTAVIYPILLSDHLALLVMLSDGVRQIRVPADPVSLRAGAVRFREKLEEMADDFQDEAMRLYDWLIRPAEHEFGSRNIDTLIIAPEGPLCLTPFSALHDGERFLVERYALGIVPALNLTSAGGTRRESHETLLCGLSEAREGFMPLKRVREELRSVQAITGGKILLDREFTTENVELELSAWNYTTLHIASHAVFGTTPDDTFLVTYDGRLTTNGLARLAGLRRYQGRDPELLVLSACETAMGDERSAFGLAGVALKSGVRSAVATLWPVTDQAAFLAMDEFYRQMRQSGISKAKALQNAQKKLINEPEYNHPAFWAPFLLIGNWQ